MLHKNTLIFTTLITLSISTLSAQTIDLDKLSGNWHLRVMDGMEVRKARAILDFDTRKMLLSGFDACNRISGVLSKDTNNTLSSKLMSTKMACRENTHHWVSTRLHEAINEGFSIKEEKKYGVLGITLKSTNHELFFKKMGRD